MTTDRWTRVEALFAEAADLAPADRPAFLDREARTPDGDPDPALREEVERLLALDTGADAFFDSFAEGGLHAPGGAAMPERVGPWRLVREIGQGGMGTVYLAERADGAFEQRAAVKLVRPGLADDLAARFRAERHVLARLEHPGIARVLDGGTAPDGRPYLALEYVDGEPITAFADRRRLSVNERLALFEAVCEAVAYAHRRLVVHRDLKPSNVLVTEGEDGQPRVKLLDFGIAKLLDEEAGFTVAVTAPDRRIHTPEYAAPEQVRGEEATTATDVYGLGVLLYELLTGARPYRVESRARRAVERAILEAVPTDPSTAATDAEAATARASEPTKLRRRLRGDLDRIVLKALRKEPERRYDGPAAFAADVRRHLGGLPVEARPESTAYRVGRFIRRHRAGVAAAAAVLVAILAGAGVALSQAAEADRQRAVADREAATSARVATFLTDLFQEANSAEVAGDTLSAREMLDRGFARVDSLGAEPEVQADLLRVLGGIYARLGRFEQAAAAFEKELAVHRALGDSVGVVEALGSLGSAHATARDYPTAIATFRAALDRAATVAVADTLLAELHLEYGQALVQSGDLEGTIAALDAAAPFIERTFPVDDWHVQNARDLRAKVLTRQEDYAAARRLYERNVRQLRGTDDTWRVAGTLNDLGYVARQEQDYAAAAAAYAESRDLLLSLDREGHRSLVVVLNNLANAARLMDDLPTAEAARVQALEIETENQPPGHWRIGSAHNGLAAFYRSADRPADALPHSREALAVYEAALGPGHVWTAGARAAHGIDLLATGARAEGERALRRAAADYRARVAEGEPIDGDVRAQAARAAESLDARGEAAWAETFRTVLPAES